MTAGVSSAGRARLVGVLALLLVVVLTGLWLSHRRSPGPDLTLGGPILTDDPDRITGILLTRGGAQYRFQRHGPAGPWSLGGAISDFVDQPAMANFLADLAAAQGGAILPGTEPEDRRYEFNGPLAIRLTVLFDGGKELRLALGTANPVTGNFYASGAGRQMCFGVAPEFRRRLAEFPETVRLRTLLPEVGLDDLESIRLVRRGRSHLLRRQDGRWWLLRNEDDPPLGSAVAEEYARLYPDRVFRDDAGIWIQAGHDAVGALVYEVSGIIVRQLVPPLEAAGLARAWDMDDPWRQIELRGPGIDPDPEADDPDGMGLVFGEPLEGQLVPVLRRGNLLVADALATLSLDAPLQDLVHTNALPWRAIEAVAFTASRAGEVVLAGEREPGPIRGDGRSQWRTTVPSPRRPDDLDSRLVGGFLVELDRVPITAALPPVPAPGALEDRDRADIVLEYAEGDGPGRLEFQVGFLSPEYLPAGAAEPAVALWVPATGQLLQIEASIPVTLRNLALREE